MPAVVVPAAPAPAGASCMIGGRLHVVGACCEQVTEVPTGGPLEIPPARRPGAGPGPRAIGS